MPLFAGLSADDARGIADIARTVRLEAGSPLFAASAPAAIWIVLNGQLAERPALLRQLLASNWQVRDLRPTSLAGMEPPKPVALHV